MGRGRSMTGQMVQSNNQSSNRHLQYYTMLDMEYKNYGPHWKNPTQMFYDYTLIVVTSGKGRLVIEGTGFQMERGSCFLVTPGISHGLEIGQEGMVYYQLTFEVLERNLTTNKQLKTADTSSSLPNAGPICCHPFSQCILLLETIFQQRNVSGDLAALSNHIRFQELLLFLLQQNQSSDHDNKLRKVVEQSIDYVKRHYQEAISVEHLAEMIDISRPRYTQLFKEITGQLPLEFLNGIRIDQAQQLLLMTDDKLHDIAQAVGFSNEYYFNRRFRQTVGTSPGQYRRQHQGSLRVFAPFLEDYMLALGITPVVQFSHSSWGKQDYLGLDYTPEFDISHRDWDALSQHSPNFIMLDNGYQRWCLNECHQVAPTFKLSYLGEDWRRTLTTIASIFGRTDKVQAVIHDYEQKALKAKERLQRSLNGQSVACLRISDCSVSLYGGMEHGYTGPVLYKDLGLNQPLLVHQLAQDERRVTLSLDSLARLDADHLFITFDKLEGEGRELLQTELWRSLPAVRNQHVYEVDFMAWMNYGVLSHSRKIDDVLQALA
ncbi:helix-turn-helix domain-containing protein [Paenibacillaceae bacterium]|nr:helix-turn-helix domain-containing protein [Paenibacillaceae bacterium]